MLTQQRQVLFPQAQTETLDLDPFRRAPANYRGAPFWAWNNRLDLEQLLRQMRTFHQMGMVGFYIHARTGLATPYLGDEFMAMGCVFSVGALHRREATRGIPREMIPLIIMASEESIKQGLPCLSFDILQHTWQHLHQLGDGPMLLY